MSYPYCYYGPTCQLEPFSTIKCKNRPVLACPIGNIDIGASAHPMLAFSGFYESHEPPPTGNLWYSTAASQWPLKQPAKWVHFASLFCWLSPCQPQGKYGASSCPMAASSGFQWSPGHAALGYVLYIAPAHCHVHRNGPQWRCIPLPPPPILIAVIIAKDHHMVH